MRTHLLYSLLLLVIAMLNQSAAGKAIIFDLNGVLIGEDKFALAKEIGISYCIKYAVGHLKIPRIRPLMYKALEQVAGPQTGTEIEYDDTDKIPLPQLMIELEKGQITHREMVRSLSLLSCDPSYQQVYQSRWEQWFIERVFRIALDPVNLAKHAYIVPRGLAILKKCIAAKDELGNPKNRVLILSNMDPETISFMYIYMPELFTLFKPEDIYISGNLGLCKPQKAIFEYVINHAGLQPENSIFVDDQDENTKAASRLGINGIHLENGNYRKLERQLRELNVF